MLTYKPYYADIAVGLLPHQHKATGAGPSGINELAQVKTYTIMMRYGTSHVRRRGESMGMFTSSRVDPYFYVADRAPQKTSVYSG